MPGYRVEWSIDIDIASSPEEAARKAFDIMQRPGTSANFFHVFEQDGNGDSIPVDLQEMDEERASARASDS